MFSWFQVDPVAPPPRRHFARLLGLYLGFLAAGSLLLILLALLPIH